jgi:PhnB protein
MHAPEAYLFFDGNCADAMRFYERALGGTLQLNTVAESPMKDMMPPGSGDRIIHARLEFGGRALMASDWMAPEKYPPPGGFSLALTCDTVAQAQKVFNALAEGGTVTMPLQKTFWSELFGMTTDRFGTRWMVNGPMLPH